MRKIFAIKPIGDTGSDRLLNFRKDYAVQRCHDSARFTSIEHRANTDERYRIFTFCRNNFCMNKCKYINDSIMLGSVKLWVCCWNSYWYYHNRWNKNFSTKEKQAPKKIIMLRLSTVYLYTYITLKLLYKFHLEEYR